MKSSIYLDKDSSEATRELPRKVSTSAIIRHILKGTVYTDKQWDEYISTNEEGKVVRAFLRDKMKKRF
jgi:hypothetical protein